jgi:hypothetical protein
MEQLSTVKYSLLCCILILSLFSCKKKKEPIPSVNTSSSGTKQPCSMGIVQDSIYAYDGYSTYEVIRKYVYNDQGFLTKLLNHEPQGTDTYDLVYYNDSYNKVDSLIRFTLSGARTGEYMKQVFSMGLLTKRIKRHYDRQNLVFVSDTCLYGYDALGNLITATFAIDNKKFPLTNIVFTNDNLASADLDYDGSGPAAPISVQAIYDTTINYQKGLILLDDVFSYFSNNNLLALKSTMIGNVITNTTTYYPNETMKTNYTTINSLISTETTYVKYWYDCK